MKSVLKEVFRLLFVISVACIGSHVSLDSDRLPKGVFQSELNPNEEIHPFKWWSVQGSLKTANSIGVIVVIILMSIIVKELVKIRKAVAPSVKRELKEELEEEVINKEDVFVDSQELQEVVCEEVTFEFNVSAQTEVKVSTPYSLPDHSQDPPPAYEEVDPTRVGRGCVRPIASARSSPNRFARNLFNEEVPQSDREGDEPVLINMVTGGINPASFLAQTQRSEGILHQARMNVEQRLRLEYDQRLRSAEEQRQQEVTELQRQLNNQRIALQLERSRMSGEMEAIRV